MEEQLHNKVQELAKDASGVLLIDDFGLMIDRAGSLTRHQATLVSSIMRQVHSLNNILSPE